MRRIKIILALLPVILLAGCCYDDNDNLVSYEDCPTNTTTVATFQCNGASCSNSLSAYNGTGSNVWSYKNSGANSVNLDVSMANISSKDITIVYTNEGSEYVTMPSIYIYQLLKNEVYPYDEEYNEKFYEFKEPDFMMDNLPELIESDDISLNQTPSFKVWSVGSKYSWKINSCCGGGARPSTLRKQVIANERTINIWVEDSEYNSGKMSAAKIDYIASNIGTVYTNVVKIAGEPWGTHGYSGLIASGSQPLDIVFFNSGGTVGGYFNPHNDYIGSDSNEAVAIFVYARLDDVSTLSTIAHELTHAINFYQRYILMGSNNYYETFLNEMTAVMMQDVIADKISLNVASGRYGSWISAQLYQQDMTDWKYSSYNIVSSFGSFLLRQHGIDFYKTLFRTNGSSMDALDNAIKVYDSGGLAKALRNWGASIAMFPAATAPKGFGYPARVNDNGFNLEAFDGNAYRQHRKLPTSSPATLAPNAHFPFLRKTEKNIYNESFVVPKGVGVSIVVK